MVPRVVLGYTLAVLAFVPYLAGLSKDEYSLAVRLTTQTTGRLHVYYDIGRGLRETDSTSTPLMAGQQDYAIPLPPGRYRRLRLDPGNAPGRYAIDRVTILNPENASVRELPLTELNLVNQLSLVERTPQRLVVDSPDGSDDPQLQYVPGEAFSLIARNPTSKLVAIFVLFWSAGVLLVVLAERTAGKAAPRAACWARAASQWSHAHPRTVLLAAAAIAAMAATYPLLLFNRSLVTPNNGGVSLLYDLPPYAAGSRDLAIEDARGSDIGAMMWQFLPYSEIQRRAIANGELPLWNRFNGAGRPLWGQGQSLLLDPLHWLVLAVPDRALGWDLKFIAHRFVFAAGVGAAILSAGLSGPAAVVPAITAPFLGYYIYRLNHSGPFSLTYAPWVLAAWFCLARARRRSEMARAACWLAIASGLALVASSPKDAAVMLAACHAAGGLALLLDRRAGAIWQQLGFVAAAGAAMLAVTAPHWLVFVDTLRRSMTTYDQPRVLFADVAMAPVMLLGPLSPVMGLPAMHLVAMILLVAALGAPRLIAGQRMLLACAVVAAALLALGFGAVPGDWLMRIPLINNIYQVHVTTISAAIVLLLVASAAGVEALRTARLARSCVITGLVAAAAAWVFVFVVGHAPRDRFEIWIVGLLLAAATAVPFSVSAVQPAPGRLLPGASVLALGALLLFPSGLHVETGFPELDRVLMQPRLRMPLNQRSPAIDAIHAAGNEPSRAVALGTMMSPGTQALYGLEGIGGADALDVAPYEELVDAAGIERPMGPLASGGWMTLISPSSLKRTAPLLDMLNVGFLLAPSDGLSWGLAQAPMQGTDRLKALRRPGTWPRAFFADGVTVYGKVQDLIAEVTGSGQPLAAVQSTDRDAIEATKGLLAPSGAVTAARAYELGPNVTSFTVIASGPGVAVLTEAFFRDDFRASVNGRRVPYFRVNHAFKGVTIPSAGDWRVAFEYVPHHWNLSMATAAGGILLLAALALSGARPRGTAAPTRSREIAASERDAAH